MHKNIMPSILVGLWFILVDCTEGNTQVGTTVIELATPQKEKSAQDQDLGSGIRIKFITPVENLGKPMSHIQMQTEVQKQMELFINNGSNEIVRVVSIRCNGTHLNEHYIHLLCAEIYYRPKK